MACSKGSWTSPDPTTPSPTTTSGGTVDHLPDAAQRLAKIIDYSCRILARTRPIHAIIRGAADNEAFAAQLGRRLLEERLTNQTERIRRYLGDQLKPGLTLTEAGQRYCALTSPELYYVLTVELGWTAEQHQHWLTQLLHTELLDTPDTQPGAHRRRQPNPPPR